MEGVSAQVRPSCVLVKLHHGSMGIWLNTNAVAVAGECGDYNERPRKRKGMGEQHCSMGEKEQRALKEARDGEWCAWQMMMCVVQLLCRGISDISGQNYVCGVQHRECTVGAALREGMRMAEEERLGSAFAGHSGCEKTPEEGILHPGQGES